VSDQPLIPQPVQATPLPHGRLGAGFGKNFFLLLFVGLVWIGPAFIQPRFILAMVAWDVLALLAWAIDLVSLARPPNLSVVRSWNSVPALSVDGTVSITLTNHGTSTVHARITDDVPLQLRNGVPELNVKVPARGEETSTYNIRPTSRGNVRLENVYLRYSGPFRIAERWVAAPMAQTVRVYPNLEEARRHSIYLVRSRQIEIEKRLTRIRGAGREFESLREYRQDDELRDICWTATGRRGKLVTRVYQAERSQSVWIVVDAGRLMRAKIRALSKLDYATTAALSLAQVAMFSGDRVGLLAYGRTIQQRVPAHRGSSHFRQIMEALADVHEEPGEADHLQAASVLLSAQKRRSLIVWITDLAETAMTPEVMEAAMQMMPRHLVLFFVIGQPDLAEMATGYPAKVSDMYVVTAAQEMMYRREVLLARVRERGALALEVGSSKLSAALVNSYLQVKQRSQL
jgi:uncharacterized protein (DUF58 family)